MTENLHAAYTTVPATEIESRLLNLQTAMGDHGFAAALILQGTDLLYFSGCLANGALLVPATGEPVYWVRRSLDRARNETPLGDCRPMPPFAELLAGLLAEVASRMPSGSNLGMELDVVPAAIADRWRRNLPQIDVADITPLVRTIRARKSIWEMDRIRAASRVADELLGLVPGMLTPGMTELELQARLEYEARRRGHLGFARMRGWTNEVVFGHVLTGPRAAERGYMDAPTNGRGLSPAFPQGAGRQPVQPGVPVSVDFMINADGYLTDVTRMYSLGSPPEDLLAAHERLLDLNRGLEGMLLPGIAAGDIFTAGERRAEAHGMAPYFLGSGGDRVSFVGHGVGLEVDEFPFIARGNPQLLEPEMVVALEPKLIMPGRGVITIENTYRVTAGQPERLTHFDDRLQIL
ncbi:MAG: aminopeptidase P family protein [Deltaproteobacteria bacterium]|nr:aminopeptidase P family protein [Candidatus Anaeroferrophillacea bacterium]